MNKQFESPVHMAVRLRHIEVLERLVAQGTVCCYNDRWLTFSLTNICMGTIFMLLD